MPLRSEGAPGRPRFFQSQITNHKSRITNHESPITAQVASATYAMRLYHPGPDAEHHQQDQPDRQGDAAGERVHGALAFAAVDHEVIQRRAEVPDDDQQERD